MTATIPRPAALDRLLDHVAGVLALTDERTLLVTALRWALDHGWEPTHNPREIGIPTGRCDYRRWSVTVEWDESTTPDGLLMWVSQERPIGSIHTRLHVTSVQQAVDVVSALTGQGRCLTTAGREAARLRVDLEWQSARRRAAELAAYTDPLTGLDNRRQLELVYRSAVGQGECALVLLDLDGFKQINDAHGHEAGDEVLVEVSRRLVNADPAKADLIVRLGGDEFAILTSPDRAASVAHRVWQVIRSAPVADLPDGASVDICASVGVVASTAGMDLRTALRTADLAMYAAKQEGGVVWHREGMTMPHRGGRRLIRDAARPAAMVAAA